MKSIPLPEIFQLNRHTSSVPDDPLKCFFTHIGWFKDGFHSLDLTLRLSVSLVRSPLYLSCVTDLHEWMSMMDLCMMKISCDFLPVYTSINYPAMLHVKNVLLTLTIPGHKSEKLTY